MLDHPKVLLPRYRTVMPRKLLPLALLCICSPLSLAQVGAGMSRVYGTDTDVPTPTHSTNQQSDVGAIQTLIDFLKATGVTTWQGMVATGTMKLASDNTPHAAKLSVRGAGAYRLDVTRDSGTDSTILSGSIAEFIAASGKRSDVSTSVAATGIVSALRLFSSAYPQAGTILTDRGAVLIAGQTLHRITLDDPAPAGAAKSWRTVDLYFDRVTGRLAKSTAFTRLSSSDRAQYMIETDFSNYQTVNGITLPYTYAESINGQPSWTLSLETLDPQIVPPITVLNF